MFVYYFVLKSMFSCLKIRFQWTKRKFNSELDFDSLKTSVQGCTFLSIQITPALWAILHRLKRNPSHFLNSFARNRIMLFFKLAHHVAHHCKHRSPTHFVVRCIDIIQISERVQCSVNIVYCYWWFFSVLPIVISDDVFPFLYRRVYLIFGINIFWIGV